ncbi:hypothetical protein EVAR_103461_1 [Eumeta japonica]|uniref:Uncharacterized protein n=1 Tax=Eumeta variegata TaxID=151549 RepID=A0A4C1YZ43_EUMVA|nr:hypothetical protein EVAR_103461_1 [Eumeta japonica]
MRYIGLPALVVTGLPSDHLGTGFDPDHERIDRWACNISQIESLAPCLREHVKPSVPVAVTAATTAVVIPAPGQRG